MDHLKATQIIRQDSLRNLILARPDYPDRNGYLYDLSAASVYSGRVMLLGAAASRVEPDQLLERQTTRHCGQDLPITYTPGFIEAVRAKQVAIEQGKLSQISHLQIFGCFTGQNGDNCYFQKYDMRNFGGDVTITRYSAQETNPDSVQTLSLDQLMSKRLALERQLYIPPQLASVAMKIPLLQPVGDDLLQQARTTISEYRQSQRNVGSNAKVKKNETAQMAVDEGLKETVSLGNQHDGIDDQPSELGLGENYDDSYAVPRSITWPTYSYREGYYYRDGPDPSLERPYYVPGTYEYEVEIARRQPVGGGTYNITQDQRIQESMIGGLYDDGPGFDPSFDQSLLGGYGY